MKILNKILPFPSTLVQIKKITEVLLVFFAVSIFLTSIHPSTYQNRSLKDDLIKGFMCLQWEKTLGAEGL